MVFDPNKALTRSLLCPGEFVPGEDTLYGAARPPRFFCAAGGGFNNSSVFPEAY